MSVETVLRKLVLGAASLLGVSYIVINIPVAIWLGYRFSQIPIASIENVSALTGITLFFIATILLMVLGGFIVIGGLQYYRGGAHEGIIFLGSLLASFYLLCLGMGSLMIGANTNINILLLVICPILVMGAIIIYMGRLTPLRLVGSISGIIGGVLLAVTIFDHQPLTLVFDWGVPFYGPFMSIAAMEATLMVLGPITGFIYSIFSHRREKTVAHAFVSMLALIYGLGTFIGSQVVAFSFLNYLWKAPWSGPFHEVPYLIFGTVAFWTASLFLLMVGGIILTISSCFGFIFAAQEFSRIS